MKRIVVASNDYITLEYWPEQNIVYHTVHQPIGPRQAQLLIETLNAGTDALKAYRACKWLSDDRKNGPLPDEVVEWGFADWNAKTIQAGWKYWANVVPEALIAAGTLLPVIDDLHKQGLRVQVFTNVEAALDWLANG